MNNRAKALLGEKFGAWHNVGDQHYQIGWGNRIAEVYQMSSGWGQCWPARIYGTVPPMFKIFGTFDEAANWVDAQLLRSIIDPTVDANHVPWLKEGDERLVRGRAVVWRSNEESSWPWRCARSGGHEKTYEAAILAADFALYCEIKDSGPKITLPSGGTIEVHRGVGGLSAGWNFTPTGASATLKEKVHESDPESKPWKYQTILNEGFDTFVLSPPERRDFIPKLLTKWDLRPNGKHVLFYSVNGKERVAVIIFNRNRKPGRPVGIQASLYYPDAESKTIGFASCGWSWADRRYLAQLWEAWALLEETRKLTTDKP